MRNEHEAGEWSFGLLGEKSCGVLSELIWHSTDDALQRRPRVLGLRHLGSKTKFRSVKGAGLYERVSTLLSDVQVVQYVLENGPGRGSGQCQKRWRLARTVGAELAQRLPDVQIGGSEIMTPLADAVGLVNYGEIDWCACRQNPKGVSESRDLESLRCNEDEQCVSSLDLSKCFFGETSLGGEPGNCDDPVPCFGLSGIVPGLP